MRCAAGLAWVLTVAACAQPPAPRDDRQKCGGYQPPSRVTTPCPDGTRRDPVEGVECLLDARAVCPLGMTRDLRVASAGCDEDDVASFAWPSEISKEARIEARDASLRAEAREAAGELDRALEEQTTASSEVPQVSALVALARLEARLGLLVRAAYHLRLATSAPARFCDTSDAKSEASAELSRVGPRVAAIRIELPRSAIAIDGYPVSGALAARGVPLDPGKHTVIITAKARWPAVEQVELAEGESRTLAISLQPLPP